MAVNYQDPRFEEVNAQKQQALTENEKLYGGMIEQVDSKYQAQIDAAEKMAETQSKLQQEQTDFTIQKIEQQKEKAEKDTLKEQKAAWADYQKQTDAFGANAEAMASRGLLGSGYSESSRTRMYSDYQNRVATAQQGLQLIQQGYDNAITEAQLTNSATLAQIALETMQQRIQLQMQAFQYKNELLLQQQANKESIDDRYYNRWMDVLDQINYENSLKRSPGSPVDDVDNTYDGRIKDGIYAGWPSNIDVDSLVTALGYLPNKDYGLDEVAALERQGVIESYVENGVIKYRKKSAKPAVSGSTMVYR